MDADCLIRQDSEKTQENRKEMAALMYRTARIPLEDSVKYLQDLESLGYDDIASLKEDFTIDEAMTFMRPGHAKRLFKAMEMREDGSSAKVSDITEEEEKSFFG